MVTCGPLLILWVLRILAGHRTLSALPSGAGGGVLGGYIQSTCQRPTLPRPQLTALDGVRCSLQGDDPSTGLWNVHPENQPDPCVLSANVRLALAQLDVRIPQLQDARTVDAARRLKTPFKTDHLSEQEGLPARPPSSAQQNNFTARHGKNL